MAIGSNPVAPDVKGPVQGNWSIRCIPCDCLAGNVVETSFFVPVLSGVYDMIALLRMDFENC